MKNTLIVNLYAGPGAGKSTGAAYIFLQNSKWHGIDCEYVSEYTKDCLDYEAIVVSTVVLSCGYYMKCHVDEIITQMKQLRFKNQ